MTPSFFNGVLYSRNLVFLTMPLLVAKSRYSASSNSLVARTEAMLALREGEHIGDVPALGCAHARELVDL